MSFDLKILEFIEALWLRVDPRWLQYKDRGEHTLSGTCFRMIVQYNLKYCHDLFISCFLLLELINNSQKSINFKNIKKHLGFCRVNVIENSRDSF